MTNPTLRESETSRLRSESRALKSCSGVSVFARERFGIAKPGSLIDQEVRAPTSAPPDCLSPIRRQAPQNRMLNSWYSPVEVPSVIRVSRM